MNPFAGTYTAIVTPFRSGTVDEQALARLIRAQIRGGVDGIVPVGTTGESPTLDFDEHNQCTHGPLLPSWGMDWS